MATIYRCDKCRSESTDNEHLTRIDIERSSQYASQLRIIKADICSNCFNRLVDWIKPDPIEKQG